ncbi:hypothetical protein FA95DRAFT_1613854 [Auriscalpium vulgare]|uniref:Uncharacterized protein n=1 Tax=Auriscalpium vulgare TaxID=40419 RepID=A0ACB8R1R8_9AGAM|nr:hypothetical protein FA95DRAFT_1613854 [Auriscalpium vulgare]
MDVVNDSGTEGSGSEPAESEYDHSDPAPSTDTSAPITSAPLSHLPTAAHTQAVLRRVVAVLRVMEYLIDSPTEYGKATAPIPHHLSDADRSLLEFASENLDKYLPFRERAPAVKRARTIVGPYAPTHVRTREGFFSALVFRSILYGAEYMFDHPFFFQNDAKLVNDYATMPFDSNLLKKKYFVDNNIYGATARDVTPVSRLWTATAKDIPFNFTNPGPNAPPIPFSAFRDKIRRMKPTRVYPQCGDLTSYLVTADYVYADVVMMPTVDEMGALIHDLGKGALIGLRKMGLVYVHPSIKKFKPKNKPPVMEVVEAFRTFFNFVSSALTSAEQTRMGWDVIMAEHFLCKISRFHNRRVLKFS